MLLWTLLALWFGWCIQATLSVTMSRKIQLRARHAPKTSEQKPFTPRAVVIVPFKGDEIGLEDHVHALCSQAYPEYTLLCVAESEHDPAVPVLRRTLAANPQVDSSLLFSGKGGNDVGQKVHNLIVAIEHVRQTMPDHDAWVFADSDAAVGEHWLAMLLQRLRHDDKYAISTGYRWLVPDPHPTGHHLAGSVASVINAAAATFGGTRRFRYAWGGSMAMRANVAIEAGLVDRLRGSLSDDYQVSRMARDLGLAIAYVPRCLVSSRIDWDWRGMVRFARRQYRITKVYAPTVYAAAIAFNLFYLAAFASAVSVLLFGLANLGRSEPAMAFNPSGWVLLLAALAWAYVIVCDHLRTHYRSRLTHELYDESIHQCLRLSRRIDRWLQPVVVAINTALLLSVLPGRTIDWRGIRYRMHGPQHTERLP